VTDSGDNDSAGEDTGKSGAGWKLSLGGLRVDGDGKAMERGERGVERGGDAGRHGESEIVTLDGDIGRCGEIKLGVGVGFDDAKGICRIVFEGRVGRGSGSLKHQIGGDKRGAKFDVGTGDLGEFDADGVNVSEEPSTGNEDNAVEVEGKIGGEDIFLTGNIG